MNRELYWKLRKIFLKYIFIIKRIIYRFLDFISGSKEYSSFRGMVIRNTILGLFKAGILIVITIFFDSMIVGLNNLPVVDKNIFVPSIIGGISVAGVILGLYCANISSIYSTVRRHIVGGANRTLFSVDLPPRLCRTGTCRRLQTG